MGKWEVMEVQYNVDENEFFRVDDYFIDKMDLHLDKVLLTIIHNEYTDVFDDIPAISMPEIIDTSKLGPIITVYLAWLG